MGSMMTSLSQSIDKVSEIDKKNIGSFINQKVCYYISVL